MKASAAVGVALVSILLPHAVLKAQGGAVDGKILVPNPGITGVVVYLTPIAAPAAPDAAPVKAEINQLNLRFSPSVVAVPPGSIISFPNSDPMLHNVFHPGRRDGFDLGTYPQGERPSFTFKEEGAFVIFCHVHPEMVAYVVVVNSPYRAVTDQAGRFLIEAIAPGTYRLTTWHRRLKTQQRLVTVTLAGAVHVDLSLEYGSPDKPESR